MRILHALWNCHVLQLFTFFYVTLIGLHNCLEGKHDFRPAMFETEAYKNKALECQTPPINKAGQEDLLPCPAFLPVHSICMWKSCCLRSRTWISTVSHLLKMVSDVPQTYVSHFDATCNSLPITWLEKGNWRYRYCMVQIWYTIVKLNIVGSYRTEIFEEK